ncbi:MAG: phenylalanine--tRNA ligase subunit beta [Candidatus Levybacteria bacterium]|nr:phenylalanine--tRNA ligase subunit beta [Candidatus Levybacteria bacterium]
MNIKILDSWLREFVITKAKPEELAEKFSLTSVSVERMEKYGDDFIYNIEVTTNRPDLMSIQGLAREASVILPEFGTDARLTLKDITKPTPKGNETIEIQNDPKLVNRICAAILEVKIGDSPKEIKDRLEASGIRSLNNLIDVTNYVMREIGHPCHVFDYDRLTTKKLIIRESRAGEEIVTLDGKRHRLSGGDIVADNGKGEIVDLLGVMGTANSVVTDKTRRILFFLDNNDQHRIRKTSMNLGIRSEAAVLNEKGVDPELAKKALLRGIELYENEARGKLISKIIDIYPNIPKERTVSVSEEKIKKIIGDVDLQKSEKILERLGFQTKIESGKISAIVPSFRLNDISIEEDLIEEIARVYGYFKINPVVPPVTNVPLFNLSKNPFYFETRVKNALKYWGFTEVYTYSMVSEELFEGLPRDGLKIANPLSEDLLYMRRTLVPSLLEVIKQNPSRDQIKVFELSNVYDKREGDLPKETQKLAGVIKGSTSFFHIKGIVEALFGDLGIKNVNFVKREDGGIGADVCIGKELVGDIEVLEENILDFELDFEKILKHVSLAKKYSPVAKYPPIVEDLETIIDNDFLTKEVIDEIKKIDPVIAEVVLLDQYENKRTFHIVYQDPNRNLSNEDASRIRGKIISMLKEKFGAFL